MGEIEEKRLQRLLDTACRVGSVHDDRIRFMREAINKTLSQLRCGQIDKARLTLEQIIRQDNERASWIKYIEG